MKAIILAAGKGERLKEITQSIPKPMIIYKRKPILQYNIELCKTYGINDIYINLYHLPEKITDYFGDGKDFGVNIHYSYEKEVAGTAGAVKKIANEFWKYKDFDYENTQQFNNSTIQQFNPFFVIYGDQFSDFNFNSLIEKYNQMNSLGAIAFHYREDVSHSGIAEFNEDGRIERFIEKPKAGESESHWVNAGIYYLNPNILEHIPKGFSDFGSQIFPKLIKMNLSLYGVCEKKEVKVFDTPEMYKKNIRI